MDTRSVLIFIGLLAGLFRVTMPMGYATDPQKTETIVLVRHGEKPENGLGQLDCQGLNRALALPKVFMKMFGKPDGTFPSAVIFAPNPSEQKDDDGALYDYVRPLATIEPSAIALGLPIHSGIGQSRIDDLRAQLELETYHDSIVLIAWEHKGIVSLAQALLKNHGGDPKKASDLDWKNKDFDSIYIITIVWSGTATTATFDHKSEGLNDQPNVCPGMSK